MLMVYVMSRVGSSHIFRACMIVISLLDDIIFIGLCQCEESGRLMSFIVAFNMECVEYMSMIFILFHKLLSLRMIMCFVRVTVMVKVCPWVVTFLKSGINMTMLSRPMALASLMVRSRALMVRCDMWLFRFLVFSVMLRILCWYGCRFLVFLIESCRMMLNW